MPFYDMLRIKEGDSPEFRRYKKHVADKLLKLRAALRTHILESGHGEGEVPHVDDSAKLLRLATWNIREFDSEKYGRRLEESYYYIAEILSNFDLVAIQEVREDRTALSNVMTNLGPAWKYIATDVTEGSAGNRERMAFIYNTNKVWFTSIAGELVLPSGDEIEYPHEERIQFEQGLRLKLPEGTRLQPPQEVKTYRRSGKTFLKEEAVIDLPKGTRLRLPEGCKLVLPRRKDVELKDDGTLVLPGNDEPTFVEADKKKRTMVKVPRGVIVGESLQLARTPSLVSFQSGWLKLSLCTVHIYYGSGSEGLERRKAEIRRLTKFLAKRAAREKDTDAESFFVALGDFNIVSKKHATMRALTTNGFKVPEALQSLPGTNVDKSKAYDQIAYWTDPDAEAGARSVTQIEVHRAGVFDFFETVFRKGAQDPDGLDEAFYTSGPDYDGNWKYSDWRTHQMSDHLPMWVELRVDFGDEYLQQISRAE